MECEFPPHERANKLPNKLLTMPAKFSMFYSYPSFSISTINETREKEKKDEDKFHVEIWIFIRLRLRKRDREMGSYRWRCSDAITKIAHQMNITKHLKAIWLTFQRVNRRLLVLTPNGHIVPWQQIAARVRWNFRFEFLFYFFPFQIDITHIWCNKE